MIQKLICNIPDFIDAYEIEISNGILNNQVKYLASLGSKFAIITDHTVSALYALPLQNMLSSLGLEVHVLSFPAGEQHKTRTTKEKLENHLFEKGFGRDSCLIALGGGVVTDIGGYLAATYCRGIPFVIIPTTLLAMVDASIGGKTGVNVPYGKNMVGCIYQPKKVLIDPETLKTLPRKEILNGIVEMLKHGLIADYDFFDYLDRNSNKLLALDSEGIQKAIFESCRIKTEIVEQDEKENGKRRLLNFGHTIGHALETLTHYSLSHGEAVAIGVLVESYLSLEIGTLSQNSFDRIKSSLVKYTLPLRLPSRFSTKAIQDAMILDKKSHKGKPRFVTIANIGSCLPYECNYCTVIEDSVIKKALEWMNDDLCSH